MNTLTQPANPEPLEELISLNRLSRKLDISYDKARKLTAEGVLKPDFTSDLASLFRVSRLPEIESSILALGRA